MSLHELAKRSNDAIATNYGNTIIFAGGTAQIAITTHGSDWYWAVCACMATATFIFLGLSWTKPRQKRIFHYITAAITLVASIAYFSMASNIGWVPVPVEFPRSNPKVAGANREIFYVRYIDWFVTTPLLLMDLLLTAGLPWPTVLWVILIDEVMIVTGLVGALVKSSYKFGYFTFGCIALLYIGWVLIFEARQHANNLGSDIGRTFLLCGTWTFSLWCLYPIAWGLCEGGNVIAPDSEAVFYGVLDLCAKPLFGALLIWGHRGIDPARLGLHIRDYDDDPAYTSSTQGHSRREKVRNTNSNVDGSNNGFSASNDDNGFVGNNNNGNTTNGTGNVDTV